MEADQPPAAEPEAEPATAQDQTSSSPNAVAATATASARSYECTFCKRGFSNAQALGGHMNIHRKERAKPKHPFAHAHAHAHFPFDIAAAAAPRGFALDQPPWAAAASPRDAREAPRQLPLFVEMPSTSTDHCDRTVERQDAETEKIEQTEIDLELRLGP